MDNYAISKHMTFDRDGDVIISKWDAKTPKIYRPYGIDFAFDVKKKRYRVCIYREKDILIDHVSDNEFDGLVNAAIGRLEIIIEKDINKKYKENKEKREYSEELDRMLQVAISVTGSIATEKEIVNEESEGNE